MVERFSHVQLVVADVAASARWYEDVLGVEQFASGTTSGGAAYVALRHTKGGFVIGMQDAVVGQTTGAGGIDHLAFALADRAALESARERLIARGIDAGQIFAEAASFNLRLRDPDGLTIELTAPR